MTGAIIGCGRIVLEHHIPAWQTLGRGVVANWAVADVSSESRFTAQLALGIPNEHAYRDYRALLLREKPNFVVIATPHVSHASIAVDCLRCGVPVLLEKPMAATLSAAERITKAAEEMKLPLAVIHNYRQRPQAVLARRLLREGAIGKPFLFRTEALGMGWSPGAAGFDRDWRTRQAVAGGGCLLDNGYHAVYMARDFLGAVDSVYARVCTCNRDIETDDTAVLLLNHASGATTSVQAAWSLAGDSVPVNEVYGTDGTLRLEPDGTVAVSRLGRDWERHAAHPEPGFLQTFQNFIAYLRGEEQPATSGRDALGILRIVRAAYASGESGAVVKVAEYAE
ncbi:MAG TPA: Gfo/Idh/MocA family oxidoreductase [Armatimonadota bacterium]|jgi:predicted dehydrogenase